MAKKKATPKIYPISRKVCKEGYNVKIDGVYLTVDPCKMELVTRGKQKVWAVEKPSPVYQTDKPIRIDDDGLIIGNVKPNDGEYFVDLTKEQIRVLAIGRVSAEPKEDKWWKIV